MTAASQCWNCIRNNQNEMTYWSKQESPLWLIAIRSNRTKTGVCHQDRNSTSSLASSSMLCWYFSLRGFTAPPAIRSSSVQLLQKNYTVRAFLPPNQDSEDWVTIIVVCAGMVRRTLSEKCSLYWQVPYFCLLRLCTLSLSPTKALPTESNECLRTTWNIPKSPSKLTRGSCPKDQWIPFLQCWTTIRHFITAVFGGLPNSCCHGLLRMSRRLFR